MTTNCKRQPVLKRRLSNLAMAVVAVLGISAVTEADASLTLNATGIAYGFSLSSYYSDPGATYGVLSFANGPGGYLYGAGYARGQLYKFNDVDGQSFGTQVLTASAGGTPTGIASVGGQVYVGLLNGGIYQVSSSLTMSSIGVAGLTFDYGLWANSVTGHLLASTSMGLVDVNPLTGAWTQIGPAGVFVDGVSVSPDGSIAYGAFSDGSIRGYSLTTPNPGSWLLNTGNTGHGADGTGVISGGLFDSDIIVNNNDGTVGLIDSLTGLETIIATGGSRGDLVSADQSNGTLLLDQYEGVLRLSCGTGCAIGSASVPEPGTLALVGLATLGLAAVRRRKA